VLYNIFMQFLGFVINITLTLNLNVVYYRYIYYRLGDQHQGDLHLFGRHHSPGEGAGVPETAIEPRRASRVAAGVVCTGFRS